MINSGRIEGNFSLMLAWVVEQHKSDPSGRGTGNPRGAQHTINCNNIIFKPLVDSIRQIAKQTSNNYSITDIWVNYSPPGCINGKHKHDGADIGGCFYLVVPENSGSIQFETGEEFFPTTGDLYWWDANTVHWVNENKSNKDRISIAFNIKFI